MNLFALAGETRERLLAHFGEPVWRGPLPAIDELVSTILSQNTNDTNRDKAFHALKTAFPSWEAVRDGSTESVVDCIKTAGLANQKGPRIQGVLRGITEERGELDLSFLKDMKPGDAKNWLMQFRGVGPKTASIVLLFTLGIPAFPVDTHIHRVTGRLGLRPSSMTAEQAHEHLAELFPPETYTDVHLNLIRLGREVCTARKPNCGRCPLEAICSYGKTR